MTPEQEAALEKIRKCMKLAEAAGTPAEAEAALARASTMMEKYKIEQYQLNLGDKPKVQFVSVKCTELSSPTWKLQNDYISALLKDCFDVEVIMWRSVASCHGVKGDKVGMCVFPALFGKPEDIEFARYAWSVLDGTFLRLLNIHIKRDGAPRAASTYNAYYNGLRIGFTRAYKAAQEAERKSTEVGQSYGLAIVEESKLRRSAMEAEHTNLRSSASRGRTQAQASLAAGIADGATIKINRGLGAATQPKALA